MRFDDDQLLVSEIWPRGHIANIGDSMANTCRFIHLSILLGYIKDLEAIRALSFFRTDTGYVRHPDAPAEWGEKDSTSDQCLPFYLAAKLVFESYSYEMKARIYINGWKTGNGTLVNPLFYALLIGSKALLSAAIFGQLAIFAIPFRWNDGTKSIEWGYKSTCDWLNLFHAALCADGITKKLFPKQKAVEKIKAYFANEPNHDWIIKIYEDAANRLF